jgi:prevent-host-death family protein
MKYSSNIKPISFLKSHASEMIEDTFQNGSTYIITKNGEAKSALMDIKEYQRLQDKLAFQKIIAISEKEISEGKALPLDRAFKVLDIKIKKLKKQRNFRS